MGIRIRSLTFCRILGASKTPAVLNKSVPVNSSICFVDYDVWPMVTRVFEWQLFKTAAGETDTPFAV